MADAGMTHERDLLDRFISQITGEILAASDGEMLEQSLAETARRVAVLHETPPPHPAFGDNLWDDVIHGSAVPLIPAEPAVPFESNGRHDAAPVRPIVRTPVRIGSRTLAISQLAAAAVLVIVLAGGLFAIINNWSGSGDGSHGNVLAPIASPSPALETTSPTSAGPVEFLWQSTGDPAGPIEMASRPAVAPDGAIWVPDGENGRFHIFSPDGRFLETWGSPGTSEGQFDFIADYYERHDGYGAIAFAPDGSFYVVDTGNQRIQKFGPDRVFLTAWGSAGSGDGQFLDPLDIALDDTGRVFVVDRDRGQKLTDSQVGAIQVFDADGLFLLAWGLRGLEPGQLLLPTGIAIAPDGAILITERDNARVQRFTPEGGYLGGWGGLGTEEGKLTLTMDVAVDAEGRAFVADTTTSRVQVFDRGGQFLATWGTYGEEAGQFTEVTGVALDGKGNVYATDESGRLQKFRILLDPLPESSASAATEEGSGGTSASDAGLYRGDPARTGTNPGPGPVGIPVEIWRAETGPATGSSPVVADGRAYIMMETSALSAVDVTTGVEIWRLDVRPRFTPSQGTAVTTPGDADGIIPDSHFAPLHGPAVVAGTVYAGLLDGMFYALDATDGTIRWRYEIGAPSCSSPVVASGIIYGGGGCTYGEGALFALNTATGEQIWRVTTSAGRVSTAAVSGGLLYAGAAGTGSAFGTSSALLALDVATGEERWRFDTGSGILAAPAVAGDLVYVGSFTGLFALDATTGELRWTNRGASGAGSVWGAPAVAGGLVFAAFDDRYLYAFDAFTGDERWRFDVFTSPGNPADPTVVDGVIYVGGNQVGPFFAIDAQTGEERWRVSHGTMNNSAATVVDGVIYFGYNKGESGGIIALADSRPP